jgi:Flp pilus assembly pilin Flp
MRMAIRRSGDGRDRRHESMNIGSSAMRALVQRLFGSDEVEGQGLVEYAMIIIFVVIAAISVLTAMGTVMNNSYWSVIASMP